MNFSEKANARLDLATLVVGVKARRVSAPVTQATRRAFAMKRAKQLIIDRRMIVLAAAAEGVKLYER